MEINLFWIVFWVVAFLSVVSFCSIFVIGKKLEKLLKRHELFRTQFNDHTQSSYWRKEEQDSRLKKLEELTGISEGRYVTMSMLKRFKLMEEALGLEMHHAHTHEAHYDKKKQNGTGTR